MINKTPPYGILHVHVLSFNFPIVNFPFISSYSSAATVKGVYISQLTLFLGLCGAIHWVQQLTQKLLKQFYCHHHDLIDRYKISISQMTLFFTFFLCTWLEYMSNMAGTPYPSRTHGFTPGFLVGSIVFYVMFLFCLFSCCAL